MRFDPQLKNALCHVFRQHQRSGELLPMTVTRTKETAQYLCDSDEEDVVPTVVWALDYRKLSDIEQLGWTFKHRDVLD